jgi:hypothetical protein
VCRGEQQGKLTARRKGYKEVYTPVVCENLHQNLKMTMRMTSKIMRAMINPVLPVSRARRVKSSNRPLALRRFEPVRSSASSVSSRREECSSSSSATRSERACWREMAEESEFNCESWSGFSRTAGSVALCAGPEQDAGCTRTLEHALLHLEYFLIRPLHLFLVFLHLFQISRVVVHRDRDVRNLGRLANVL